jgi:hypothetical protein
VQSIFFFPQSSISAHFFVRSVFIFLSIRPFSIYAIGLYG